MKIILIVSFVFSAFALAITRNFPCTGYEASIFKATPPIFWAAMILDIISGVTYVVHQVYAKKHRIGNSWVAGFILILFAYISILSVWIIRGYIQWGTGDPLSHISATQTIISSGHAQNDFYPIVHIYLAEFSFIIKIGITELYKYITLIFDVFYVIFIYVMAKSIFSSKGTIIISILASLTFLYSPGLGFAPNTLANLFLPFAIFLLIKSSPSENTAWKVLFLIAIFIFPPFHPVTSLALFIFISAITIPSIILSHIGKPVIESTGNRLRFKTPIFILFLVWSVYWFSSFGTWNGVLSELRVYFSGTGTNRLFQLNQQIAYAVTYRYNVLALFFKIYGGILVYILFALALFPLLLQKTNSNSERKNLISLYGPLVIIALTTLALLLLNISDFSPLRLLDYISLIGALFVGFGLNRLIELSQSNKHKFTIGLVPLILLVLFITGTLKLYPSRYTLQPNDQVTRTELNGINWFFKGNNPTEPITGISVQIDRFADFLLSSDKIIKPQSVTLTKLGTQEGEFMPWHFRYDEYKSLGNWYKTQSYLVITQEDKVLYQSVYPEMQEIRFTLNDFNKLEQDPSLRKLYTNGGLDIFEVSINNFSTLPTKTIAP